ncbi:MAG: metallophosphoesterase [Granulosicoccus sp.]|nr:metallophosphoesterase [Granulosicoccus sp.]
MQSGKTQCDADEELRCLEDRINAFHLNQRLGIEEHREAWIVGQGTNFFHIENWNSIHTVIRGGLGLLNLRRRGQRNALAIELDRHDIRLRGLPEAFSGYTVLHLSDLHLDINAQMPAALIRAIESLDYDLCVMTGDYRASTWGDCGAALKSLRQVRAAITGEVYAILGNHDSIRMVPHMENMHIQLLINESATLTRHDQAIFLSGIDDPHYYRSDNMERACDSVPRDAVSILLSHSPEIYRQAASARFDLMLCGHTHGGQICLPGGIPLMVNANCPRQYCKGLWRFEDLQGYTSVGSGASVVDIRLNCPPQVSLLRLLPDTQT